MAIVSFVVWGPSETCNGDKSDLASWIELKEPGVNVQILLKNCVEGNGF